MADGACPYEVASRRRYDACPISTCLQHGIPSTARPRRGHGGVEPTEQDRREKCVRRESGKGSNCFHFGGLVRPPTDDDFTAASPLSRTFFCLHNATHRFEAWPASLVRATLRRPSTSARRTDRSLGRGGGWGNAIGVPVTLHTPTSYCDDIGLRKLCPGPRDYLPSSWNQGEDIPIGETENRTVGAGKHRQQRQDPCHHTTTVISLGRPFGPLYAVKRDWPRPRPTLHQPPLF